MARQSPLVKVVLGLAVLAIMAVLFLRSVRSTRSAPFAARAPPLFAAAGEAQADPHESAP